MKIIYSAPAKVILSGEHGVVYGKPALVSAVDLRLKFTLTNLMRPRKNSKVNKEISFISQKVKDYLKKQGISFSDRKFEFQVDSETPVGRGLGSSAALSIASVAAFLKFYTRRDFNKETINNLAYQIEKYFHKNPSGADNTASCFGGLIYFRKEFEFLKNISALNFKIPKSIANNLFLIDTGKPKESTAEIVAEVGKLYNRKPKLIENILNNIEKTTKKMVISIVKEDREFFQKTIRENEKLLEKLKVVSLKTKSLLKKLEKFGAGKITGAGGKETGSGFILFLAKDKEKLEEFLKRKKIDYYQFVQDYQGLKKL